ncbi:Cap15 family CBASS effector [Nitrolancea hollandica]|uniref:Uncharacterized protein n=1 Tax=Nitrolancea hollandica Lb TaxID=1129897 RepID=I4EL17_9BACT|nr:hypothetical protein [Nitrolancea hollandica]CCF85379.1 conserved hypothetical protein [Nitrolancea hollandica Lb]
MHDYSTDSEERKWIPVYLAVLSILLAWLLSSILSYLSISIPWMIDAPSVVGFYGITYVLFDRYLWKMPFFRTIRLVNIPDLSGTWQGYLVSSYDEHAKQHETTLLISQTWSKISIILRTKHSSSRSMMASIEGGDPNVIRLMYGYLNEPNPESASTMVIHLGTACLKMHNNSPDQSLDGEYYAGRGRMNYGGMHFKR